jgi:hypothetical protein
LRCAFGKARPPTAIWSRRHCCRLSSTRNEPARPPGASTLSTSYHTWARCAASRSALALACRTSSLSLALLI